MNKDALKKCFTIIIYILLFIALLVILANSKNGVLII